MAVRTDLAHKEAIMADYPKGWDHICGSDPSFCPVCRAIELFENGEKLKSIS